MKEQNPFVIFNFLLIATCILHSPKVHFTDILKIEKKFVRLHYYQQNFMHFAEVANYFLHFTR